MFQSSRGSFERSCALRNFRAALAKSPSPKSTFAASYADFASPLSVSLSEGGPAGGVGGGGGATTDADVAGGAVVFSFPACAFHANVVNEITSHPVTNVPTRQQIRLTRVSSAAIHLLSLRLPDRVRFACRAHPSRGYFKSICN